MAAVCGGGPVLIKQPTRTARLFSFASHIFIVFASISLAALYSQDCVSKKRNGKKKQQNLSLFFAVFSPSFLCVRVCFPIEDLLRPQLSLPADRNKKIRTSIFLLVFLLEMQALPLEATWRCPDFYELLSASLSSAERAFCWEKGTLKRGQFFSSIVELSYRIGRRKGGNVLCWYTHHSVSTCLSLSRRLETDWTAASLVCLSIYKTTNGCCDWWPIERHRSSSPLSVVFCFILANREGGEEEDSLAHVAYLSRPPGDLVLPIWRRPEKSGILKRLNKERATLPCSLFFLFFFFQAVVVVLCVLALDGNHVKS